MAHTEPQLLTRHQTLGNQAMQRMLRSKTTQAKLAINEHGDQYEQEADRVAEQMMCMPDPHTMRRAAVGEQAQGVQIQRMCSECEEELHRQPFEEEGAVLEQIQTLRIQRVCSECEEELRRQPVEEEEEVLQTKEVPDQAAQFTPGIEASVNALRGGGQPLPQSVRAFFEPRLGHDFDRVRTDARAVELAEAVNAPAYTVGEDIVFGEDQYSPLTTHGWQLLAHELTHVVQQQAVSPELITSPEAGNSAEREAEGVASAIAGSQMMHAPLHTGRHPRALYRQQAAAGATPSGMARAEFEETMKKRFGVFRIVAGTMEFLENWKGRWLPRLLQLPWVGDSPEREETHVAPERPTPRAGRRCVPDAPARRGL